MSDDTTYGINYGPVPTLAPGARTLLDTARGRLRAAVEHAIASDVRPEDAALILVNGYRDVALSGPAERLIARIVGQLLEHPEHAEKLAAMVDEVGAAALEVALGVAAPGNPYFRPLELEVIVP